MRYKVTIPITSIGWETGTYRVVGGEVEIPEGLTFHLAMVESGALVPLPNKAAATPAPDPAPDAVPSTLGLDESTEVAAEAATAVLRRRSHKKG